jgi:hypothetical protein
LKDIEGLKPHILSVAALFTSISSVCFVFSSWSSPASLAKSNFYQILVFTQRLDVQVYRLKPSPPGRFGSNPMF